MNVKLKYLDDYIRHRQLVAQLYEDNLNKIESICLPQKSISSLHIYHQYTIRVKGGKRDQLKKYLDNCGISTMIYYPIPIHHQPAMQSFLSNSFQYPMAEQLCQEVLSLPIHSHLSVDEVSKICDCIKQFFSR